MFRPNVTVACVIHCHGEFLMVEEIIDGRSLLNQPAGHLEKNESLIEAMSRETFEETGLEMTPDGWLGNQMFRPNDSDLTFLRVVFCKSYCDKPNIPGPKDPDIDQTSWLTKEQIQTSNRCRSSLVMRSIDWYLTGQFLPLDRVILTA